MALSPLAGALATFTVGLIFGVVAVTAVAVAVGRPRRGSLGRARQSTLAVSQTPPPRTPKQQPALRQQALPRTALPGQARRVAVLARGDDPPGPTAGPGPVQERKARPSWPEPISVHDESRLLVDLGSLGVTVARGPADLVDRVVTAAATDLAAQLDTRSFTLILAGFDGVAGFDGGGVSAGARLCADLTAALDLVAANAVTVRRRLDEAATAAAPDAATGAEPVITVLVSRLAPAPAELRLLADLVADPGRAAALVPASSQRQIAGVRVLALSPDPAKPGAFAARLKASGTLVKPRQAGLRIGVLGPLTINDQPAALLPAQSQLIVALALHGEAGLSNKQLCRLLGADDGHPRPSDSLRQLIVRTRRQLGRAGGGLEWIEHRGAGKYALHRAATVDWVEFEEITSRAIAGRDAGQLAAALAMVRGQPFTGCYYWWLDYALVENVRSRIVVAAETLGKLALAAGNPAQAARAARAGLVADDSAERLWRVLMRAEHAAGNRAGVLEAWTRCLHAIADISADGQPERATVAVYQELGGR